MVRRVWSLAERLAVGIGTALLALSLILGGAGYAALSSLFESNLVERAESQARQLALFSADAILVYDYATLERYAQALAQEPGIETVSIHRKDGELLASAGDAYKTDSSALIHVVASLSLGASEAGVVELSVNRRGMEASLRRLAFSGLAVLAVVLVTLFWFLRGFVDRSLIQPVQQLAQAANPLSTDHCPEPQNMPAELERLAQTFGGLCGDIKMHLQERDHAERMARDVSERLTREQRLATVGQMAAGLAHNLNTPLGSIKGYAQLLEERADNDVQRHQAGLIVEQAESCAATVRNLLTAVRMPEVERLEFDFRQQVEGVVELIRPLLDNQQVGIEFPADMEDAPVLVEGDPGAVEQILFNLLTNAAEAGANRIVLRFLELVDPPAWQLQIADNGPGIPRDIQNYLFDPFITDKAVGEGTGLGLYMSRQIARKMGAELSIELESGVSGACFALSMPCKQSGLLPDQAGSTQ